MDVIKQDLYEGKVEKSDAFMMVFMMLLSKLIGTMNQSPISNAYLNNKITSSVT